MGDYNQLRGDYNQLRSDFNQLRGDFNQLRGAFDLLFGLRDHVLRRGGASGGGTEGSQRRAPCADLDRVFQLVESNQPAGYIGRMH